MARIEWVKYRLDNWALWKARQSGGGLGFYASSSFLHDAASDRYREAVIPVDEVDASVTDQAVESLRPDRQHLYDTLHAIYIAGTGIKAAARLAGRAESTIRAHLEQADQVISVWFRARADRLAQKSSAS